MLYGCFEHVARRYKPSSLGSDRTVHSCSSCSCFLTRIGVIFNILLVGLCYSHIFSMCLCCGHDDMAANFAISLEPSETKSENFDTDNDNADAAVANLLLLMYREKNSTAILNWRTMAVTIAGDPG